MKLKGSLILCLCLIAGLRVYLGLLPAEESLWLEIVRILDLDVLYLSRSTLDLEVKTG